jgi:hypothetical protein
VGAFCLPKNRVIIGADKATNWLDSGAYCEVGGCLCVVLCMALLPFFLNNYFKFT